MGAVVAIQSGTHTLQAILPVWVGARALPDLPPLEGIVPAGVREGDWKEILPLCILGAVCHERKRCQSHELPPVHAVVPTGVCGRGGGRTPLPLSTPPWCDRRGQGARDRCISPASHTRICPCKYKGILTAGEGDPLLL